MQSLSFKTNQSDFDTAVDVYKDLVYRFHKDAKHKDGKTGIRFNLVYDGNRKQYFIELQPGEYKTMPATYDSSKMITHLSYDYTHRIALTEQVKRFNSQVFIGLLDTSIARLPEFIAVMDDPDNYIIDTEPLNPVLF